MKRPRTQRIARASGFKSLEEAFGAIDQQYARVGKFSAGEDIELLRALAVGADAVYELSRLVGKPPAVR